VVLQGHAVLLADLDSFPVTAGGYRKKCWIAFSRCPDETAGMFDVDAGRIIQDCGRGMPELLSLGDPLRQREVRVLPGDLRVRTKG